MKKLGELTKTSALEEGEGGTDRLCLEPEYIKEVRITRARGTSYGTITVAHPTKIFGGTHIREHECQHV